MIISGIISDKTWNCDYIRRHLKARVSLGLLYVKKFKHNSWYQLILTDSNYKWKLKHIMNIAQYIWANKNTKIAPNFELV